MSGMREGWFIADADGFAVGPLTRAELVAQHQRGLHGLDAMAWHVEIAEWRPLDRIAAATAPEMRAPQTTAAERAEARAEARVVRDRAEHARAAEPRPERTKPPKRKPGEAGRPQGVPPNAIDTAALKRLPPAMQAEALKRLSPAMRAEAEKLVKGGASPESAERAATALRRFFARVLDTFTLGMLAASVAWAFVLHEPAATAGIVPTTFLLYAVAVLALLPVEALALSMFGATPGKALLGLTVRRTDGQRVTAGAALQRAWKVTWRGIALGVPVVGFITSIVAFTRYSNTGRSSWDADEGTEVRAQPIESWRWQAAAFAAFLAFLGMSSGFWPGLVEQLQAAR